MQLNLDCIVQEEERQPKVLGPATLYVTPSFIDLKQNVQ